MIVTFPDKLFYLHVRSVSKMSVPYACAMTTAGMTPIKNVFLFYLEIYFYLELFSVFVGI